MKIFQRGFVGHLSDVAGYESAKKLPNFRDAVMRCSELLIIEEKLHCPLFLIFCSLKME